jgi:hypothetical protein
MAGSPNLMYMHRTLVLTLALLLTGCASLENRPPPLSREDIEDLARAGTPAAILIEQLKATQTVLRLSASDLIRMSQAGVPDAVLDWLQQAQIGELRRREALYMMYGHPVYGYPGYGAFGFGPCPPGWGVRFGHPAFRMRGPFWPGC